MAVGRLTGRRGTVTSQSCLWSPQPGKIHQSSACLHSAAKLPHRQPAFGNASMRCPPLGWTLLLLNQLKDQVNEKIAQDLLQASWLRQLSCSGQTQLPACSLGDGCEIWALFHLNSTSPSLLCGDCWGEWCSHSRCVGSGVTLQEQPFEKPGSYTEVVFEERQSKQSP